MLKDEYVDLNPDPLNTSYGDLVYGEDAVVVGSLRNLFQCPRGDRGRIFRPDYYTMLYDLLHEPLDNNTAAMIRVGLIEAVARWEPRIEVLNAYTSVEIDYRLPGYLVTIGFRFRESIDVRTAQFGVQYGGSS
jgi:phage baseplate assembly protein W